MKYKLILSIWMTLLTVSASLYAQGYGLNDNIPVDEENKIEFEKIITIDGDEKEAFNRAREWFLNSYEKTGAYPYTRSRDDGRMSGPGKFDFEFGLLSVTWQYQISYVLTVDAQDKKARIRMSDFIIKEKANKTNSWKSKEWPAERNISDSVCFKKNGKVKSKCQKFKTPIVDFANQIISHFEKAMKADHSF